MLLANMAVAHKISSVFTDAALLRCHPPPLEKGMQRFVELAKLHGYTFDTLSSGALHASFEQISDPIIRHVWRLLAIKFMKRAIYFNTGDKDISTFKHYALSVPLYTHFTSPIRRYADLAVHRMLQAILQNEQNPYVTAQVTEVAKQCNLRKEISKTAQEASQKLYLGNKYLY
jgi:exoribonuclease R